MCLLSCSESITKAYEHEVGGDRRFSQLELYYISQSDKFSNSNPIILSPCKLNVVFRPNGCRPWFDHWTWLLRAMWEIMDNVSQMHCSTLTAGYRVAHVVTQVLWAWSCSMPHWRGYEASGREDACSLLSSDRAPCFMPVVLGFCVVCNCK